MPSPMPSPAMSNGIASQRVHNAQAQGSAGNGWTPSRAAPQVHRRSPSPTWRGGDRGIGARSPQGCGLGDGQSAGHHRHSVGPQNAEERLSTIGRGPQPPARQNRQSLAHTTAGHTLKSGSDRARVVTSHDVTDKVNVTQSGLPLAALGETAGPDTRDCGSPYHCARMLPSDVGLDARDNHCARTPLASHDKPEARDIGSPYHCARLSAGGPDFGTLHLAQSSLQLGSRARALPQGLGDGTTAAGAAAAAAAANAAVQNACAPLQFPSRAGLRSDLGAARSVSPQRRGARSSSVCISLGPSGESVRPKASHRSGSVCFGLGGPLPGQQVGATEQSSELRGLGLGNTVTGVSRRSGSVCVGSPPRAGSSLQTLAEGGGYQNPMSTPRQGGALTSLNDTQSSPMTNRGASLNCSRTPSSHIDFVHDKDLKTQIVGELESVTEQHTDLRMDTPPPMGRCRGGTVESFKLPGDLACPAAAERLPLPAPVPGHGAPLLNSRRVPASGTIGLSPGPPGCPTTSPPCMAEKTDVDNSHGSLPSDTASTVPSLGNAKWQQEFMESWFGEADAYSEPSTPTRSRPASPGREVAYSLHAECASPSRATREEHSLTIPVSWSQARLQALS